MMTQHPHVPYISHDRLGPDGFGQANLGGVRSGRGLGIPYCVRKQRDQYIRICRGGGDLSRVGGDGVEGRLEEQMGEEARGQEGGGEGKAGGGEGGGGGGEGAGGGGDGAG